MKLGVLIDRLNVGGVEKIALEEVIALRKIGIDAELVVLRKKGVVDNAFEDLRKGVPITFLDERLPLFFRLSFSLPLFHFFSSFHITYPFVLPFVVKRGEYDYLIPHGSYTTLSAIALKKTRKIHFSAFIWDPATYILDRVYKKTTQPTIFNILRFFASRLDKFIINNSDRILVGGDAHNTAIQNINPKKSIDIIYPSVHPVNKQRKKKPYILMATAWKRGKNPEYILELAPHISDIPIKMAGKWLDPDYKAEFEAKVKKNNLTDKIEIIGELSEKQLSDLYAEALFVLQTNDDRGFGMPALEAAGKATTFIIPKDQGVCKLFEDGKHGYYTIEKDTKKIVELVKKLTKNPDTAAKMGEAAWQKVIDNYSWEQHAEQLLEVVNRSTT